jgi:ubiquinol-cytochrome c reductase cytochrome b subunit
VIFWVFIANFLLLGEIGQLPVEDPYILMGQICTLFYFSYYFLILPGLGLLERVLIAHYLENAAK